MFENVMFNDILLAPLGNMPFLNNSVTFPTTSVRGCSLYNPRHPKVGGGSGASWDS